MVSSILKRGLLIAVEGMDGSGKSTFTQMLAQEMYEAGAVVNTTLEVGGTAIGQKLRTIAFNTHTEKLEPSARLLMVIAARIQHIEQVIKPRLFHGIDVVTDRYNMSTLVYQGYMDEQLELYSQLNCPLLKNAFVAPDVVVYLDVTPEEATNRRASRAREDNTTYKQNLDMALKIHGFYGKAMSDLEADPGEVKLICRVDANCAFSTMQENAKRIAKDIVSKRNYLVGTTMKYT